MQNILEPRDFPPLLREIPDAPRKLYCKGKKPGPDETYFAVVGTRHASAYGKNVAYGLTADLAAQGFIIVSGLAYGIDACAHRAALDANGTTIAVLGSGLDIIAPECNTSLAGQIIEKDGALISEYPPGAPPYKSNFPERNRIIAGTSCAVLVVEAPEKSGALITARLALEYNREVFAVPGPITQESCMGTNGLIRDGKAQAITSARDILSFLPEKLRATPLRNATTQEREIYLLLKNGKLTLDFITHKTDLAPQKVASIISSLELKGLIKKNFDGSYTASI